MKKVTNQLVSLDDITYEQYNNKWFPDILSLMFQIFLEKNYRIPWLYLELEANSLFYRLP